MPMEECCDMSIFLDQVDVALLTGKKTKSGQIARLRSMGLLFYVNATGHAVVPRSSVEKMHNEPNAIDQQWIPRVLSNGQKA